MIRWLPVVIISEGKTKQEYEDTMEDADKENHTSTSKATSTAVKPTPTSAAAGAPKSSTMSSGMSFQVPWIEKYRPETLDQMVGNEETLVRLQAIAKDGNLPNLILAGPPGTGKVRCLYGGRVSEFTEFEVSDKSLGSSTRGRVKWPRFP